MDFDLEKWWQRNGLHGSDIYTDEETIYNFCSGLVGDVLNQADKKLASLRAEIDQLKAQEQVKEKQDGFISKLPHQLSSNQASCLQMIVSQRLRGLHDDIPIQDDLNQILKTTSDLIAYMHGDNPDKIAGYPQTYHKEEIR